MAERLDTIRPYVAQMCALVETSAADTESLDRIEQACLAIERLSDDSGVGELAVAIRHSLSRLRRIDDAGGHMVYASCVGERIAQLRDYLELHPIKADRRSA